MEFILTIDTEGDNQWTFGKKLTVENIKFIPRFQQLCNKYFIKPTYLVTSEVCDDAFAKEIFTDYLHADIAEIGSHLHSWTTPPFQDRNGYRYNDFEHPFVIELSKDLLKEKLKYLTNQIEDSFGIHPQSFRSGRYGFNEYLARILAENSYLVDSSVTPYMNWSGCQGIKGGEGGPDFLDSTPLPYEYKYAHGSLIEIPVTILPTKFPLNRNKKIAVHYFRNVNSSIPLRIFRKLLFQNQPLWLRPYPWMNINMFDNILGEAQKMQLPYVVMMFHSSELMPGCSIYRTTKNDVENLYNLLERFFILLHEKKIASVTLIEAAKSYTL